MRERSEKIRLTDLKVAALAPKLGKSQYDVFDDDSELPGFGIRITSTGTRTFMLLARFPGSKSATRRAIGTYPKMSLAKARRIAEEWLALIKQGTDPAAKQREEAEAAERAKSKLEKAKFETVAERFIVEYVSTTRRADTAAREIRREFIKPWGHRAITDIEAADVLAVIKGVLARGAKYQARNLLIEAKTLFKWAVVQDLLKASPCVDLDPRFVLKGHEMQSRDRILANAEIAAFWNATGKLNTPWPVLFRMLLMSGLRRSELGEATWDEIDLENGRIEIDGTRIKNGDKRVVVLTKRMVEMLASLPRMKGSKYVFTVNAIAPVSGYSVIKTKIDALMEIDLDEVEPWRTHDLRRTCRTGLAALGVSDVVAELILGHRQGGVVGVYNQHKYEGEQRAALEQWQDALARIVKPGANKVVRLQSRG
jgi:integrase